mgnify:CR=1 FL=1
MKKWVMLEIQPIIIAKYVVAIHMPILWIVWHWCNSCMYSSNTEWAKMQVDQGQANIASRNGKKVSNDNPKFFTNSKYKLQQYSQQTY